MKSVLILSLLTLAFSANATLLKNKPITYVYEYDASKDSKAVGVVDLRNLGVKGIQPGCAIEDVQVFIETSFDDAGNTATVVLGNSVDDDGYLVDFMTIAEAAPATVRAGQVAGALLWDNTNDNMLSYLVPTSVAAVPKIKIGTEALTAGKAKFIFTVRCY